MMIQQYSTDELQQIADNFAAELRMSVSGALSSLPFIRHTLPKHSAIETGELFQVMVIGGTNFQSALVTKSHHTVKIRSRSHKKLPAFLKEEDLCELINSHLDGSVSHLVLNFAYPLKPIIRGAVMDGIFKHGSKEHSFTGLVGKVVGEMLEQYIKYKRDRDVTIGVANDTICLLLAGLQQYPWDQLAAAVVGTGINSALFLDKYTAVNLESGNFSKFTHTPEGRSVRERSSQPATAPWEKEIAGAYLYKHYNTYIQSHEPSLPLVRSTEELAALGTPLAAELLTRSAALTAAQIAGTIEFLNRDCTFIMQGSLFWQGNGYKNTVETTLQHMHIPHRIAFAAIEDSELLGAAQLL